VEGGACGTHGREKSVKRPPGRHRRRWGDGIRMDLTEIGWGGE
jgi:hypothetical protein